MSVAAAGRPPVFAASPCINVCRMDAFIRNERSGRAPYVLERSKVEYDKAKREAKSDSGDRKARLTAELSGPCQVYKG